ncbi:hypothetical protein CEE37_04435 [candidate division LCP-89 bacterium B3_LCP]|uniref:PorV/PorQ family protein n=1 Tax=candidate division LCP-89 bacterium B3_LCP TaxID=2012998 RepID=A0A532V3X6_UNCL8|nr:MAG: hypothetical protein CEE37_04435 [candidate division LCP-89 bacterium B3_LCP]
MPRSIRTFRLVLTAIIMFSLSAANVYAGSNAGMAGAFLRMGLGARSLAMGDVGVAIPGDGFGIYYNPASLPFLEERTFLTSYNYLSLDRHLNFVGFATPLRPPSAQSGNPITAGLGVGWINAGTGDIDGRDTDGNPIGTFKNSENAFYFAFALRISDKIAIGFAPKVLYNSFPDLTSSESFSSTRLGFDAGLLINPMERLYLGVQARNINAQYRWDSTNIWGDDGTTATDKFPRVYRFGGTYLFDFGLLAAAEFETSDQQDNSIHAGIEYRYANFEPYEFSLRAGYNDADLAFGFGFVFSVWQLRGVIDYAYQIEDIPPYDSQVISFSLIF